MHWIAQGDGYRSSAVDLDKLFLGGRQATSITREDVYDALAKLRVQGIRGDMGRQQLLLIYAKHQSAEGRGQ